jgi:ABC-type lipopolysaccharide export system ATPase subunit
VLLELDGAAVRFRNGALGVEDVSLQVDSGSIIALFGPNGAGKLQPSEQSVVSCEPKARSWPARPSNRVI